MLIKYNLRDLIFVCYERLSHIFFVRDLFLMLSSCCDAEVPADFLMKLEDGKGKEGEDVTFKCKTNDDDVPVFWFVNGKPVPIPSDKYIIRSEGYEHTLTIKNLLPEDACEVTAVIGDNKTSANLAVEGDCHSLCRPRVLVAQLSKVPQFQSAECQKLMVMGVNLRFSMIIFLGLSASCSWVSGKCSMTAMILLKHCSKWH